MSWWPIEIALTATCGWMLKKRQNNDHSADFVISLPTSEPVCGFSLEPVLLRVSFRIPDYLLNSPLCNLPSYPPSASLDQFNWLIQLPSYGDKWTSTCRFTKLLFAITNKLSVQFSFETSNQGSQSWTFLILTSLNKISLSKPKQAIWIKHLIPENLGKSI